MYDQQREAYVQSVLARILELEQQLAQAKQQQTKQEASPEGRKCGGNWIGFAHYSLIIHNNHTVNGKFSFGLTSSFFWDTHGMESEGGKPGKWM